jgi:beta-lactam-binding protein with PASTA domain
VGEVRFEASTKPAGTVLGSVPAGGTRVTRTSAVSLVLSDGRPPTDTLPLAVAPSVSMASTTLSRSRFLP